uniref:Uncharacterized protein n=1 Tax=Aegilops tauschii TaxID=37682 RepID=M8CEI3_AEGTA
MGNVEKHLGNSTPTNLLHYRLSDMWRSPRGTVLRIDGLAMVAIGCSFFLAAFGSCRHRSSRWIIQKGFLAAQALSLSLGTYSIGLMQSSPVKSEMYPIWDVSLLAIFGCVDPITTYIGLEYKGPLLKMIFQLCLYYEYVILMSVSTISGVVSKLAIGVLSTITFVKGFHMSLALVLPSRTRDDIGRFRSAERGALAGEGEELLVHLPVSKSFKRGAFIGETFMTTSIADILSSCKEMLGIEDVCLGYFMSHLLQQRFLGMDTVVGECSNSKNFLRSRKIYLGEA